MIGATVCAVAKGEQLQKGEVGLLAKGNQLAILRQYVLAEGGPSGTPNQLPQFGLKRGLTAVMPAPL